MLANLSLTKTSAWNLINLSRGYFAASDAAHNERSNENTSAEHLVHHWLESCFKQLQLIVLWREPLKTLTVIPAMLMGFFVVAQLPLRVYSLVFSGLFIQQFTIVWFRHVWPEIRVPAQVASSSNGEREEESSKEHGLMSLKELQVHLLNLINFSESLVRQLLELRQRRPIHLCLSLCFVFSCTVLIGSRISGFSLTFILFACTLLMPGIYSHLLTQSAKQMVSRFISNKYHQLAPTSAAAAETTLMHSTESSPHNVSLFDQLKQVSFLTCYNTPFKSAETQQSVTNTSFNGDENLEQEMIEQCTEATTNALLSCTSTDSDAEAEDDIQEGFVIL